MFRLRFLCGSIQVCEMLMSEKKIYYGIDYCKLLCAVLIVYMHSVRGSSQLVFWVRDVFTTIAVPYFFIVSGFFYGKGLMYAGYDNSKEYTKRYFKRLFILYTAWSVLVIPVSILCIVRRYPDSSVFFRVIYLIRMYFLSGSCGIYWYILALLINCWLLYLLYIKKISNILLGIIAISSFVIGVMYNSHHFQDCFFFELIHVIFSSPNNFLHTGLIYMLIGYYFAFREIRYNIIFLLMLFVMFVFARSWECKNSDFQFVQLFLAVVLFLISSQKIKGDVKYSKWSRRLSMALYLEHFPILLLIDYYYWIDSFYIVFSMMLMICTLLYFLMRQCLPNTLFMMFYGENK